MAAAVQPEGLADGSRWSLGGKGGERPPEPVSRFNAYRRDARTSARDADPSDSSDYQLSPIRLLAIPYSISAFQLFSLSAFCSNSHSSNSSPNSHFCFLPRGSQTGQEAGRFKRSDRAAVTELR